MKSLWKSLVNSTLIIAGASLGQTLVAQEIEQAGVVRISSPSVSQTACTSGDCNSMGSGTSSSGVGGWFGGSRMRREYDGTYDIYGRRNRRLYRNGYSDFQTDGYGNGASAGNGSGFQDGYADGGYGYRRGLLHGGGLHHGYYSGCPNQNGEAFCNYLRCKFGYFHPTGGGGQGLPWCGHYSRVYPLSPYHSDPRDGQAWAAQGYGVPISVPLAPVVAYTYEYGWGIPSSRIVPISRPAY